MIPYREEKIKNAAIYFTREHRKRVKKPLYQTYLYKYLAFLDFCSIRETGMPALDLTYQAMERGPVPLEVYNGNEAFIGCRFIPDQVGTQVVTNLKPNLDYFSDYEIELMNRLLEFYAQQWMTTQVMSDATHEDILAWRRTPRNKLIEKALEFEGDLSSKRKEELTFPETVYLTHKALTS